MCALEHGLQQDCAFAPTLVQWFFACPNANLYHARVTRVMQLGLDRGGALLHALLTPPCMGRFVAYFQQHAAQWPRPPCMGHVVQVLHRLHVAAQQ